MAPWARLGCTTSPVQLAQHPLGDELAHTSAHLGLGLVVAEAEEDLPRAVVAVPHPAHHRRGPAW